MINNTNNCACPQCERRDEQQKLSKYRQILDKLHSIDKAAAKSDKEYKQQKIDYIQQLLESDASKRYKSDVLHCDRYKYTLRYLDDDAVLIVKQSMQDNKIVDYHVLSKSKLDSHVESRYYRYKHTIDKMDINCTRDACDVLLTLANLDVCEYMTKKHY
ncbi:hypothetical protein [Nitrospira sp. BLG_2]|uniref:hypothetical protein n=1 Tax=Nitrospira sp. BLG_2 TaxID=3397507 RepID=UPI003B9BE840